MLSWFANAATLNQPSITHRATDQIHALIADQMARSLVKAIEIPIQLPIVSGYRLQGDDRQTVQSRCRHPAVSSV